MRGSLATVETVLGPVEPDELGITLMHEHLFLKASNWFVESTDPQFIELMDAPHEMVNLDAIRRAPNFCKQSMVLEGVNNAVRELRYLKESNGKTVVDVTVDGIGRDPESLVRVSRATGLNIIAGCGYYVQPTHLDHVPKSSVEDLAAMILKDLTQGIGNTGIKAGVIGEIGVSPGQISPDEMKVLRAAGRAEVQTGVAMTVHTYEPWEPPEKKMPLKVLDVLEREGVDLTKVYMSHMDWTFPPTRDWKYVESVLDRGAYAAFDNFGTDFPDSFNGRGVVCPTDYERSLAIRDFIQKGYVNQILISHDICQKHQLRRYGGFGYSHIPVNGVRILRHVGIEDKEISTILRENPRKILSH